MNSLPSVVSAIIVSNVLLSLLGFKNQAFFKHCAEMGSKMPSGPIWGRFGIALRSLLEFVVDLGVILMSFGGHVEVILDVILGSCWCHFGYPDVSEIVSGSGQDLGRF